MSQSFLVIPFLCAAGLCASLSISAPSDYATIPPDPVVVTKELEGLEIKLSKAIEIAQKEVGGLASQAKIVRDGKTPSFEVEVYCPKFLARVSVDAHSGNITNRVDVPRFPGQPVSGNWTELPSGLKYYELQVGDGAAPSSAKNPVTIIYTGWLVDGTRIEGTEDHGQPLVIAADKLVAGLEEGVLGMKIGGKRKLIMPYDLAYGLGGKPPQIPPKATLIFDVALLALP